MTDKRTWQADLDKFLAKSSLSLDDQVLARTYHDSPEGQQEHTIKQIENALHIEKHLDEIGMQDVPVVLQNKLKAIGKETLVPKTKLPTAKGKADEPKNSNVITANFTRFGAAISALAASVTIVVIMSNHWLPVSTTTPQPTLAEINQAQQELAVAFRYLSIARNKSASQVKQTINLNLHQPMMKSLLHPLTLFKES